MLPLLLSLHLLSGPATLESRLHLLPELHAQTAAQTPSVSRGGSDFHVGEVAIGTGATLVANGLVMGAGFVGAVFLALSMLDGSHNSTPWVVVFVVAAVLFEGAGVPAIAAETVHLVSRSDGDEGSFNQAFVGGLIGNALGLPLLGGSFLLLFSHAINSSNVAGSIAIVGAGALLQAICVSVGASLGGHWTGGAQARSGSVEPLPVAGVNPAQRSEPRFEAPRPSAAVVSGADSGGLDVQARPVAAPGSVRWGVPVLSVPLG